MKTIICLVILIFIHCSYSLKIDIQPTKFLQADKKDIESSPGNNSTLTDIEKSNIDYCKNLVHIIDNLTKLDSAISELRQEFINQKENEQQTDTDDLNEKEDNINQFLEKISKYNTAIQGFRVTVQSLQKGKCESVVDRIQNTQNDLNSLLSLVEHEKIELNGDKDKK